MTAHEQSLRAIDRANQLRPMRAELKRIMKKGDRPWRAVLTGDDPQWEAIAVDMRVRHLVESVPGIGTRGADEILEALGIRADGTTRLRELSYAGRQRVADLCDQALGLDRPGFREHL